MAANPTCVPAARFDSGTLSMPRFASPARKRSMRICSGGKSGGSARASGAGLSAILIPAAADRNSASISLNASLRGCSRRNASATPPRSRSAASSWSSPTPWKSPNGRGRSPTRSSEWQSGMICRCLIQAAPSSMFTHGRRKETGLRSATTTAAWSSSCSMTSIHLRPAGRSCASPERNVVTERA